MCPKSIMPNIFVLCYYRIHKENDYIIDYLNLSSSRAMTPVFSRANQRIRMINYKIPIFRYRQNKSIDPNKENRIDPLLSGLWGGGGGPVRSSECSTRDQVVCSAEISYFECTILCSAETRIFCAKLVIIIICTITEKSAVTLSLGGDNLKRYFDQR